MADEGISPDFSEAFERIIRKAMEHEGVEQDTVAARRYFAKDIAETAWDLFAAFRGVGFEDEASVAFTDTILAKLMEVRRLL